MEKPKSYFVEPENHFEILPDNPKMTILLAEREQELIKIKKE